MPPSKVVLTEEQDSLVHRPVASGRFQNARETMRAGLRLPEQEASLTFDPRARMQTGLAPAQSAEFAPGTGPEAVRAAIAEARQRRGSWPGAGG